MLINAASLFLLFATSLCQDENDPLTQALLRAALGNDYNEFDTGITEASDRTPQASTLVPLPGQDLNLPCTTKDNEPGECVAYYLCNKDTKTITENGFDVIDIRGDGGVCLYMDICCRVADQRPQDDPVTPKPPPKEQQKEGCGWTNPRGVGMTIKGNTDGEAQFGEFPWMVAVLTVQTKPGQEVNTYVGGGSLIHMKVVLTTAHHVAKATELRIRAGEWDTHTTKELYPHQDRDVETKEVHAEFNKGPLYYDVALLFLRKPVDPAPHIGVACLPPPKQVQQDYTKCFATGWGKDKFGNEGLSQVILKKVELPVVKHEVCQRLLRKGRVGNRFKLHHTFMCAGGVAGQDVCTGDGGSPLVCPIEHEPGRFVEAGMVAWGLGCGEDDTPGVYADVAKLRAWIDDKMAAHGYENEMVYAKY